MKIYYARPIWHYDKGQDTTVLEILNRMPITVIDPNQEKYQKEYEERGMDVFLELVENSDMFVFKRTINGNITPGVYKEMLKAQECKIPIFDITDLQSFNLGFSNWSKIRGRVLSVEKTRQIIKDYGIR